jgi:hypothetical protein
MICRTLLGACATHDIELAPGRRKPAKRLTLDSKMVGGTGHYLNSQTELGRGILDLMKAHRNRLGKAAVQKTPAHA